MSDDWTPIEKAGKYGGPVVLIDREPIIRRLQDGLIASRAKLAVTVHRPKIYADTSHIEDRLAAAIAGQTFQWGDPVEERESDIELPAAYWASDKLGHAWLDLWHSGDARLESADRNERASFYGLQLLVMANGNGRRAEGPQVDAKPETNGGDPTEAQDRQWLRISKAVRILHRILKARLAGQEPAPWIDPPADSFDADCANATHRHRRAARTSLTMRRALLSGNLTAHLVKDGRSSPIPGWAWENASAAENAFNFNWLPLNPLLDHGLQENGDWRCFVSRAEFKAWVANPGVARLGDLPTLPVPFDRTTQPDELAYREPPGRPFIELTQALTWIAFAVSLSRDEFSFMESCRFGPFREGSWPDALRAAMSGFADLASAGNIRVRGRYVTDYSDHSAAAKADTEYLSDTQSRDFACFDSLYGGLERGAGLVWETDVLDSALEGRGDGWRDVEVCRAELMNAFPPRDANTSEPGPLPQWKRFDESANLVAWLLTSPTAPNDYSKAGAANLARLVEERKVRCRALSIRKISDGQTRLLDPQSCEGQAELREMTAILAEAFAQGSRAALTAERTVVPNMIAAFRKAPNDVQREMLGKLDNATNGAGRPEDIYLSAIMLMYAFDDLSVMGGEISGISWKVIKAERETSSYATRRKRGASVWTIDVLGLQYSYTDMWKAMGEGPLNSEQAVAPAQAEGQANDRAPSVKSGRSPGDDAIRAKADEMKERGLTSYEIASRMRFEPGFENAGTVEVRTAIRGRYRGGRPKDKRA